MDLPLLKVRKYILRKQQQQQQQQQLTITTVKWHIKDIV